MQLWEIHCLVSGNLLHAATCNRMKGLLQQQATRYPLEHIIFANIQTKFDKLDGEMESITY